MPPHLLVHCRGNFPASSRGFFFFWWPWLRLSSLGDCLTFFLSVFCLIYSCQFFRALVEAMPLAIRLIPHIPCLLLYPFFVLPGLQPVVSVLMSSFAQSASVYPALALTHYRFLLFSPPLSCYLCSRSMTSLLCASLLSPFLFSNGQPLLPLLNSCSSPSRAMANQAAVPYQRLSATRGDGTVAQGWVTPMPMMHSKYIQHGAKGRIVTSDTKHSMEQPGQHRQFSIRISEIQAQPLCILDRSCSPDANQ